MDTKPVCKECGASLAADAPEGLCPKCLMKVAMGSQAGTATAPQAAEPFPLPDPARLAAIFPQLQIIELLGRGGMGAVYKARQPSLDRMVALKILPPTPNKDAGFAERFNREARALAKLSHPNIVAVCDFGEAGGLNYFIMEYVDGPNLRQVERSQKLSPAQALRIIPQICEALEFAHEEGVVHRDIKPENVLLDKKGRVKIADFGLAKILGVGARDSRLTGARDVMGTPHYMAPEQVEHPQEVDHRADIYSLGVVFYELLTGELPLGKFAPPSKKVEVDVRLDEIVLHTLEKEPALRYQRARDVKTDVETIAGSSNQANRRTPEAVSARQHDDVWRQVKGPALGLVAVGILNWLLIPVGWLAAGLVRNEINRNNLSIIVPVTLFVTGGIIFAAGLRMRRLEGRIFAMVACALAILVPVANLIGLAVGIWALIVLSARETGAAFAARARGETREPAPGPSQNGALKATALLLGAVALFFAIPVGALMLAMVIPAWTRARQNTHLTVPVPSAAVSAIPVPPQHQRQVFPGLDAWLAEEDIDLNRAGVTNTPIVQVMIEDVQPDGTAHFRSIIRRVVEEGETSQQQFVNSDFVDIQHLYDAAGHELSFKSLHQEGRFQYTVQLLEAPIVGSDLIYGSEGIVRNQIEEREPGVFSYEVTHYPNAGVPCRRVEVHRLPPGAKLLEFSSKAATRVRNGRTEVVLDEVVPPGEGSGLSYRYQYPSKR